MSELVWDQALGAPPSTLDPIFADAPFSAEQRAWLSGFLAGIAAGKAASGPTTTATLTVQVLYGTQTGNSLELAETAAGALRGSGLGAELRELDAVSPGDLAAASHVLVITSTYGEGEMPDNAELFWDALAGEAAPRLEQLSFSVLALGDSGYDDFCQAGKLIDLRLEQLGATRIEPRVDCDVDFDGPAAEWTERVTAALVALAPAGTAAAPQASPTAAPARPRSRWNRNTPYASRLAVNRVVSGPGSAKEIRHFEFDLGDSDIAYSAGDALAVVPRNDPGLVGALLERLGIDPEDDVDGVPVEQRLHAEWEIRTPSKDLVAGLAERAPASELASMVRRDDRETLDSWLWGRDVLDLLEETGVRLTADELGGLLRPLQARQYSISSSPLHSPDRIHLTIASVRHAGPGASSRVRGGVCSTFLADRCGDDGTVGIFPQPNHAFSVPEDPTTPIIMIGPGTGIAPFRGFLQERAASGATGGNWLFFGDQHRTSDFIYEDELTDYRERGLLTRLDLAFSRDQTDKIYVQTRMREAATELYRWVDEGAYLYVCGDASRMAKDVDRALHDVVESVRGLGDDDAAEYVAALKREKRYVRDVY